MIMPANRKEKRRTALREMLTENPFLTDGQLAAQFAVSISTIRLDRAKLGIPEVRIRTLAVAHGAYDTLKSLGELELIGELQELVIGEYARSELQIDDSMVLAKAQVARGHHLFAQANSLAIALVDAEVALTGSVRMKFVRPVRLGETVLADGKVLKRRDNKYLVDIIARVQDEIVFKGKWIVFAF